MMSLQVQLALASWSDRNGFSTPESKLKALVRLATNRVRRWQFRDPAPPPQPVDILFLHMHPGEGDRLAKVRHHLTAQGLRIQHLYYDFPEAIRDRRLASPSIPVLERYLLLAACAAYLARQHRPRVLVTLENHLQLSPFLRAEMKPFGHYVNLSHCVTAYHALHSITDFDYYFLFGPSSLRNLLRNPVRFGKTQGVFAGSPFIDFTTGSSERPPSPNGNVLYLSSWVPPSSIASAIEYNRAVIFRWARHQSRHRVFVKPHPLEDATILRQLVAGAPQISVLPTETSFPDALRDCPVVLHQGSNAALEAAVLGRPSLTVRAATVSASDRPYLPQDWLDEDDFFPPGATDEVSISAGLETIEADYDHFVRRAFDFARHHLSHFDGPKRTADLLAAIAANDVIPDTFDIEPTHPPAVSEVEALTAPRGVDAASRAENRQGP